MKNLDQLILTVINRKVNSEAGLEKIKKEFARKNGHLVKKYQLLSVYRKLLKQGKISQSLWLEKLLLSKPIRTLSGVTPLTVLLKPFPCPGQCLYCPDQPGIPKSYLRDEPAVLRARQFNFDPKKQVKYRLKVFHLMGHRIAKIELIVLGGSFSFYPQKYRREFIKACFEASNQRSSLTLNQAQKINETAKRRIIGLTIETRPDLINKEEIKFLRYLGVTRVELGVQSLNPQVLRLVKRGHGIKAVIKATQLLKNAGFKVCYHLMPSLPGSTFKKDQLMFRKIFTDSRFRPDYLKIYPCVVVKESPLYEIWRNGRFKPLIDNQLVKLLVNIKKDLPAYVRINRLGRDIPVGNVQAGYRYTHIRQLVQNELKTRGLACRCIRCREIRQAVSSRKLINCKLRIIKYRASAGWDYFLEFVDKDDRLYGYLRLRLPSKRIKPIFACLRQAALIRELHVLGQSLAIGEKKTSASQHQGLGRRLIGQAEKISRQQGYLKIAIISGVGVREYYRKFGYQLKRTYMVKEISS